MRLVFLDILVITETKRGYMNITKENTIIFQVRNDREDVWTFKEHYRSEYLP